MINKATSRNPFRSSVSSFCGTTIETEVIIIIKRRVLFFRGQWICHKVLPPGFSYSVLCSPAFLSLSLSLSLSSAEKSLRLTWHKDKQNRDGTEIASRAYSGSTFLFGFLREPPRSLLRRQRPLASGNRWNSRKKLCNYFLPG